MNAAALDTSSWSAFEATLGRRLGLFGDGEFVSIAEGRSEPEPVRHRGLFGRVFGGDGPVDAGAFVQAQRTGDLLYVECVGSRSFGGRYAFSPQQETELAALGWLHRPELAGDKVYVIAAADPEAAGHLPLADEGTAASAAFLMVATMRDVLGAEHPSELDVTSA